MRTTTTQITIRLTEEQKNALERAAEREQRPVANLVKVILSEWLAQHQSEDSAPQSDSGTGTR